MLVVCVCIMNLLPMYMKFYRIVINARLSNKLSLLKYVFAWSSYLVNFCVLTHIYLCFTITVGSEVSLPLSKWKLGLSFFKDIWYALMDLRTRTLLFHFFM